MMNHWNILLAPKNYLDPGTGSMIVQYIIAGIAVASGFLFVMREKIKGLFMKKKSDEKIDENSQK